MSGRNAEKLFEYYRRGRSQCRYSSSMATKESQPWGVIKEIGEGVLKLFNIGAVGGFGYVLGGLVLTSKAPHVKVCRKAAAEMLELAENNEIWADGMREWWYLNRQIKQAKNEGG